MADTNGGPEADPTGDFVFGWELASRPAEGAEAAATTTIGWFRQRRSVPEFSLHLAPSSRGPGGGDRSPTGAPTADRSADPVAFPAVGETLGGFRLVGELGRGAFARVYLAEQPDLADRPVALKVSRALGDEPQALARLQHTHIVPVYSVHDDPDTGLRLLCMPYLGGANLAQVLERAGARLPSAASGRSLIEALDLVGTRTPAALSIGPGRAGPAATAGAGTPSAVRSRLGRHLARLPWWSRLEPGHSPGDEPPEPGQPARQFLRSHTYVQAAVWIAARLAEALEHAHARGILHRDIKPSNVLIAADGTPMLLDFNLAAEAHRADPAEGERAMVGGTLPYMAPEHLDAFNPRGETPPEAVDERSDLYALGLILFEMVAGRHPFADPPEGVPLVECVRRLRAERLAGPTSARAINPLVPPSLDAILRKCLAPDPNRRFACAGDLAEDLRRFLGDLPLRSTRETSPRERLAKWLRRHPEARSSTAVGGLAAALILGIGTLAWAVRDRLEVASARVQRAEFRRAFEECQLLLNTTSGPLRPSKLAGAIGRATRALDAYGVGRPGDWTGGRLVRRLPPAEARALREEVSELILLRARARKIQTRNAAEPVRRAALEEAVAWLDLAERYDPRPSAALLEERAYLNGRLGRADLAARDRARAAALVPRSARDFYLLGNELLAAGRLDRAEGYLRRAVALDPRRFWAWFALGLCHHDQGRFDASAGDFAACTALVPGFAWPHNNRGLALAAAGRLDEARAAYDRALEIAPDFLEARVNRALACLQLGDPGRALADLDRVVALGSRDASILAARAEALGRLGRRDEAMEGFAAALRARPEDPLILAARGFARLKSDPTGAEEDFARALARDPSDSRAHLGLAHLLRPSNPRAALRHADRALADNPDDADALQLRAILRAHLGAPATEDDVESLIRRPTAHNLYNAACALAILSETTGESRLLPRALGLLRRALEAGFPRDGLDTDDDLEPLRARPEWVELRKP